MPAVHVALRGVCEQAIGWRQCQGQNASSVGTTRPTGGAGISLPVWTPATTEGFATYGVLNGGSRAQGLIKPRDARGPAHAGDGRWPTGLSGQGQGRTQLVGIARGMEAR